MHEEPDRGRDEDGFRNRGAEVTRMEAFFDAAFAFAVTLMVISIDAIPNSAQALVEALKAVPAFAASFLLIVLFWRGHADWSRRYGLNDRASQRLGLLMVFLVLVFIYPLRMVYASFFAWITGGWLTARISLDTTYDLRVIFAVFAFAFGSMGLAMYALYRRAWALRDQLGLDPLECLLTRHYRRRWLMIPLFSLASLSINAALPADLGNNFILSLPGLIFFVLEGVQLVLARRTRRAARRLLDAP